MSDDASAELRSLLGDGPLAAVVRARVLGSRELREGPYYGVSFADGRPDEAWQVIERTPSLLDPLERLARAAAEASRMPDSALWPITRVERVVGPGGVHRLVLASPLASSSLEARLQRGERLSAALVAHVAERLARGLAALHARGIVHRALRASTVVIDDQHRTYVADASRLASVGEAGGWPSPDLESLALDGGAATEASDAALVAALVYGVLARRPLERVEVGAIDASRIAEQIWGQGATSDGDHRYAQEAAVVLARGLTAAADAPDALAIARGLDLAAARLEARRSAVGRMARGAAALACVALLLLIAAAGVGVGGRLREDRRSRVLEPGMPANPLRLLIVMPAVGNAVADRARALEDAIGAVGGTAPLEVRCLVAHDYDEATRLARVCDLAVLPFQCFIKSRAIVDPALFITRDGALHYYSQVVAGAPLVERLSKELAAAGRPVPEWPVRSSDELARLLQTYIDRVDRGAELGTLRWAYSQPDSSAGHLVFDRTVAAKLDPTRLVPIETGSYERSLASLLAGEAELATFVAKTGQDPASNLHLLAALHLQGDVARLAPLRQLAILADQEIPNDVIAFRKDFDARSRGNIERLLLGLDAMGADPKVRDAVWKALSITGIQRFTLENRALIDAWVRRMGGR